MGTALMGIARVQDALTGLCPHSREPGQRNKCPNPSPTMSEFATLFATYAVSRCALLEKCGQALAAFAAHRYDSGSFFGKAPALLNIPGTSRPMAPASHRADPIKLSRSSPVP